MRTFYPLAFAIALMLSKICVGFAAPPTIDAATRADRQLQLVREAWEKQNFAALSSTRNTFRSLAPDHPLAPYAEVWWLLGNLARNESFAISNSPDFRAFLSAHGDTVLADQLRREWLRALGKQSAWSAFEAEYARLNVDDSDLACHHWRARWQREDRSALAEARVWFTAAKTSSDACHDVFARLREKDLLDDELIWTRVRRLLEDNQLADARRSITLLGKVPPGFEAATATIGMHPARWLENARFDSGTRASVELNLFAINRLARSDAAKAAAVLAAKGSKLPTSELSNAWAQVGHYAAMQHDPSALEWFRLATGPLTDQQAGWKARAALRAGDWETLRTTINSMSAEARREPTWRYWLARAEAARNHGEVARTLRTALAKENHFYALLAAEELGVLPTNTWQPVELVAAELDAMRQRPDITRALHLYRLGMKPEGMREWQRAIRDFDDRQLLTAAEVARRANIPDRAISTAERTLVTHDFTQRFPLPWRDSLKAQANNQRLDEAWVYGLIRQESRFMADARSPVGAIGLMQLMPTTARWAAKQVGLKPFNPPQTSDIAVNLTLGAYYLRHVLDDLGHPVLATAAYNAGPGRARRWRAEAPLEGAIYAETIPFNETRDYVKKVMANRWYYSQQMGVALPSLKAILGTVPGRNGLATTAMIETGSIERSGVVR